jgi:putative addiction module CopG family antidote
MPFVVPEDVEELVANQMASGRYRTCDEVLRSAMKALAEVDDDLDAVRQALSEWRGGDEGILLEDAFRQIRTGGPHGAGE